MDRKVHTSIVRYGLLFVIVLLSAFVFTGCDTTGTPPQNGDGTVQAAPEGSVLAGFPLYPQTTQLPNRVEFEWKNLSTAYTVPDSDWAYYLVPAPYLDVAAFYKVQTLKPPFANKEIYWKETDRGVLSAYYQKTADKVYSRIWFIPHPTNANESYLIIMRNNDIGGCSIF